MESSRRKRVRHEIRYDEFDSLEYRVERVEVLGYFATREEAERAVRGLREHPDARCDSGDPDCDVTLRGSTPRRCRWFGHSWVSLLTGETIDVFLDAYPQFVRCRRRGCGVSP